MNDFCIIGAGRIANSLVEAIHKKILYFDSVIDSDMTRAESFAKKFGIKNFSSDYRFLAQSSYIFLTIPDAQIEKTAKTISKQCHDLKGKLFIHCSGSLSVDVLKSLKKRGAETASFHPMMTFPNVTPVKLNDVYVAVEAYEQPTEHFLFELAKELKMKPFKINPADKIKYHMLGVFGSNFMVANLLAAKKIAEEIPGIPPVEKLLKKLCYQTLDNILQNGVEKALSGPVQRGDVNTIKKHHDELSENENLRKHYKNSSMILTDIVSNKNKQKVVKILKDTGN